MTEKIELTQNEYDVLQAIDDLTPKPGSLSARKPTQQFISKRTGIDLDSINAIIVSLRQKNYISTDHVNRPGQKGTLRVHRLTTDKDTIPGDNGTYALNNALIKEDQEETQKRQEKIKILQFLLSLSEQPTLKKDIVANTNIAEHKVPSILQKLEGDEFISQQSSDTGQHDKIYTVTATGRDWLEKALQDNQAKEKNATSEPLASASGFPKGANAAPCP